jgi:alpha-amylase
LVAERRAADLTISKSITISGDRLNGVLALRLDVTAQSEFAGTLELEWNVNLLGGGGNPAAFYRTMVGNWPHDSHGSAERGAALAMGNEYEGTTISVSAQPPARQDWFAVETVSNSETGFEKVYQGSCLIQRWPLALAAGESASFATVMSVAQSRDRAAEEEIA